MAPHDILTVWNPNLKWAFPAHQPCDQQCMYTLSKKEHCLLLSLQRPIKCPNMVSLSLKFSKIAQGHLFNLQTKEQVDCMLGLCFIETKWMRCKYLLFMKWMEIQLGPCIKSVNSWRTMGSCIMHSLLLMHYVTLTHWNPCINLYINQSSHCVPVLHWIRQWSGRVRIGKQYDNQLNTLFPYCVLMGLLHKIYCYNVSVVDVNESQIIVLSLKSTGFVIYTNIENLLKQRGNRKQKPQRLQNA